MSSLPATTSTVASQAIRAFEKTFHRKPSLLAAAPGRINLIGEHVDYQEGLVLPAAIDRHVFAAAAPIDAPELRLWSRLPNRHLVIPLSRTTPLSGADHWANYAFGVHRSYRQAGHPVNGVEIAFETDLPAGAGLSSSAALESATALVLEESAGLRLPPSERARLCQRAEHDYAGVPCGIMDQTAVNLGVQAHALALDCRTLETELVPMLDDHVWIVVDSKVKHALADSEYATRRQDCEEAATVLKIPTLRDTDLTTLQRSRSALSDRVYRRAHHVVTEIQRVREFRVALAHHEVSQAGRLMTTSHASLRDDFEVSCRELDVLADCALKEGAIGARMMGAGFGGSTLNLLPQKLAEAFVSAMETRYGEITGNACQSFIVNAVDGAGVRSLEPN